MFCKRGALKNFAIFTGKHLYWSLFADLQVSNFIKKRLQSWCFPVNTEKFLRTPILKNICERLLWYLLMTRIALTPWAQDVNWTSYLRSIYVLCTGAIDCFLNCLLPTLTISKGSHRLKPRYATSRIRTYYKPGYYTMTLPYSSISHIKSICNTCCINCRESCNI